MPDRAHPGSARRWRRSARSASSTTCSMYFDDRRAGGSPSGPAGPRVAGALDAAADTLGPSPAMIADRGRLRILLASLARTLHVGVLADCFFDPSTALCLKRVTAPEARCAADRPVRADPLSQRLHHRAPPTRLGREPPPMPRRCCARSVCPSRNGSSLRRDLARFQAVLAGSDPKTEAGPPARFRGRARLGLRDGFEGSGRGSLPPVAEDLPMSRSNAQSDRADCLYPHHRRDRRRHRGRRR